MDQEKVGNFIKNIRKENKLTQQQLADKYNVTYQAVSKWENGKNLPDISLLKQMSKDFNVSLDEIFEGKYEIKEKQKKKNIYIVLFFIIIIMGLFVLIFKVSNNNFNFKTLSSNCDNFNISGSISYNNNKSAIYISNIKYCGTSDTKEYENIECVLYESNNDIEKIIGTSNYSKDEKITLEKFLENVTFSIDNYSRVCKEYTKNSLYLRINATDINKEVTTYKIPLILENNCNK